MRTTRTRRLTGVLLATALILAACGGSADVTATDTAVDEPAGEATAEESSDEQDDGVRDAADDGSAAGGAFAFEHFAGTTEVPVDPQRIVTLQDQNALLPLLELGVPPIASAALDNGDGTHTFRRVENYDVDGIEFIGPYGEPDLELIAAQQPDLIIGGEFDEPIYDQLSQIAPTVLIQIFSRPLIDALEDFAVVVGTEERHAELLDEYEQAVADLIADLRRPPEEIVLSQIQFSEDGQFYIPSGQAVGTVIADVGFARPDAEIAAMADPEYDYSSFETLTEHDGDVMLTADFSADGDNEGAEIAQARQQPVFQGLNVVERGEFHVFDGGEMVGSAFEKMINFVDFLRETLVERDPALTPTG
jgi:iron complex transport system substrate-binding protein